MAEKPSLILINPWIYDFAAYDLWSKPLGLLYIAAALRRRGFNIHLIDCLNRNHGGLRETATLTKPVRRKYGTGKFWKKKVPKPEPLKHVPRTYSRYGMTTDLFIKELRLIRQPAAILVTSLMTYWYPGVFEAISISRECHPDTPIILGGIYARLCEEHARMHSRAHWVDSDNDRRADEGIFHILNQMEIPTPNRPSPKAPTPYPAFDMQGKMDYVCVLTSTGCPYRCHYCASGFLHKGWTKREPVDVLEEILFWHHEHGVRDFAFYDDALLVESESHIEWVLEKLIERNLDLRFHSPNGLHVSEISQHLATLLMKAGFKTIRLGLETSDQNLHHALHDKFSQGDFEKAVYRLKKAGFAEKDIGAYILTGLPGQSVASVMDTIKLTKRAGASPYLAEFSPIPHTPLWKKALSASQYDLADEPLYHNNTLLPCWDPEQRKELSRLKQMVLEVRQSYG